jgi:hypothetical protein
MPCKYIFLACSIDENVSLLSMPNGRKWEKNSNENATEQNRINVRARKRFCSVSNCFRVAGNEASMKFCRLLVLSIVKRAILRRCGPPAGLYCRPRSAPQPRRPAPTQWIWQHWFCWHLGGRPEQNPAHCGYHDKRDHDDGDQGDGALQRALMERGVINHYLEDLSIGLQISRAGYTSTQGHRDLGKAEQRTSKIAQDRR